MPNDDASKAKLINQEMQMKHENQMREVLNAIRNADFYYPSDIKDICAALASKLDKGPNRHSKFIDAAIDSLDDLYAFIDDGIE